MSQAETFKHAAIYSVANMLGKMISFIMLPLYAHSLGTDGYGVIGMVDAAIALLTSVLAYGCQGAITRLYHEQPEASKRAAISTGYWVTFISSLTLVMTAMATSSWLAEVLFGDRFLSGFLAMALLSFFLDMNTQAASTVLTLERKSVQFSLLSLLRLVCGLTLNIIFIVVFDWGLFGYFLSGAITSFLHFSVMQRICFHLAGTSFDSKISREIINFQIPLIPGALVSFASRQTERIALRFFESIEKVGVLEMAYKFPSLITILIHEPFMRAWNTERVRLAQANRDDPSQKIGDMFTSVFYPLVGVSLLIALCIGDVLVVLTPPEFWEAERIAQIECLTIVFACTTQHVSFGYLHTKDSRHWAILTSGVSLAKIGLSFAFVATLGILGAAYSALIASMATLIFSYWGGQRRYRIKYRHFTNASVLGLALGIFIVAESFDDALMEQAITWAKAVSSTIGPAIDFMDDELRRSVEAKLANILNAGLRCTLALLMLILAPFIFRFPFKHTKNVAQSIKKKWL